MEIFHDITKNKGTVLALGYFDGIHIGHKKIISTLLNTAKEFGAKSAIVTFSKNPADYFNEEPTYNIQTFKDRELILDSLGVDYLYELDFEKYKDLSAFDYLKNVIVENFSPKAIVVGYNHTFGKNKLGDAAFLKDHAQNYDFEAIVVPEQKYKDTEQVSSSIIRKRIQYGHLNAVKAFLGRHFSVRNSVIKGQKIARKLGYPTINLVWPNSMVKLPYGVYFGYVQLDSNNDSKLRPALISWGIKPTLTDGNSEILEAHIYDCNEDLYGKIVKVVFVKKVRDEENFHSMAVLKTQLQKDYSAFEKWARMMS